MSTDNLPEQLRDHKPYFGCQGCIELRDEAADALDAKDAEIERLRAELDCFETVPVTDELIEQTCVYFHDAYERAAIGAGWETQIASRKPWADVPEANKQTMRDTIKQVLPMMPVQYRKAGGQS